MNKNAIKNVIIINDFDYVQGGASKVAIDTANILVNHGVNVYFFSGVHSDFSILDEKVLKVNTNQLEALNDTNKIRGCINGIYNLNSKKQLKKLLLKLDNKDTIIHIHGWTKCLSSSIFSIIFSLQYNCVITLHDYFILCPNGGMFNYNKNCICQKCPMSLNCIKSNCDSRNYLFKIYRIIRQIVQNKILNNNLKYAIALTNSSKKIYEKKYKNLNISLIPNPVESSNFSINYKNNKYFLFVGRVTKEKGIEDFCKVINKTKKNGVVVGDGPDRIKLENKYPNIKFVGWKNENEVSKYMINAKALIFSSVCLETFGLTVVEALLRKIPCIVSNKCVSRDFIENEKNGLIYDNLSSLEKYILNFDNYNFKITMYDDYSYDTYYNRLINLYNNIMKGN